jgi:hypothetical protein
VEPHGSSPHSQGPNADHIRTDLSTVHRVTPPSFQTHFNISHLTKFGFPSAFLPKRNFWLEFLSKSDVSSIRTASSTVLLSNYVLRRIKITYCLVIHFSLASYYFVSGKSKLCSKKVFYLILWMLSMRVRVINVSIKLNTAKYNASLLTDIKSLLYDWKWTTHKT